MSLSHAQEVRIPVDEIVVTGNTLLAPDVLQATLAPFKGELTLDDLKRAA